MLKGRLHQAVSLAQVGEADRWPKIKHLAEDVLQQLGVKKCTLWLVADGLLKVVVFFSMYFPKTLQIQNKSHIIWVSIQKLWENHQNGW